MKIDLEKVLEMIDAEPDYPDPIPADFWLLPTNSIDWIVFKSTVRAAVRLTKDGIKQRIMEDL